MPQRLFVELKQWRKDRDVAAGEIYLALEETQKIHVREEPVKMWAKLESVHLQKCPATRFYAYNALFSIRRQEDESLTGIMTRVDHAMQ